MRSEPVVIALDEDLVARGLDRLLEREEPPLHREVDRCVSTTAGATDTDFIRVANERRIDREPARRTENVGGSKRLRRDHATVHRQLVADIPAQFAADAEVIVEGE